MTWIAPRRGGYQPTGPASKSPRPPAGPGSVSPPPFRPDPEIIGNIEGNRRIRDRDREAAREYLRPPPCCDCSPSLLHPVRSCGHHDGLTPIEARLHAMRGPDPLWMVALVAPLRVASAIRRLLRRNR